MNSHVLPSFWVGYRDLDPSVKALVKKAYRLWTENPFYPSLKFKCINKPESIWAVRVSRSYRALGILDAIPGVFQHLAADPVLRFQQDGIHVAQFVQSHQTRHSTADDDHIGVFRGSLWLKVGQFGMATRACLAAKAKNR